MASKDILVDLYVDGDVGIGTSDPSTSLEVVSSGVNGIDLSQSESNASQSGRLFFTTNTPSEGFLLYNNNGKLQVNSGGIPNSASGTERLTIVQSSGNVGIGTNNPQEMFHVQNFTEGESHQAMFKGGAVDVGDYSYISLNNGFASEYGKEVRLAAVSEATFGNKTGFAILTSPSSSGASGNERLRVTHDGDVGIGTDNPSYTLDVTGTIRATGTITENSDESLKENINTIENACDKVSQIRGVEYNKIGEEDKSIGVIAQEIERVIPEVVTEDKDGIKSVAYTNLVGLLIQSNKELIERVTELENIINNKD